MHIPIWNSKESKLLEMGPRASHMPSMHPGAKLHPYGWEHLKKISVCWALCGTHLKPSTEGQKQVDL